MAYYIALYFPIVFSILILIPNTESSRCSKTYSFQGWQLNSSIPSDLYPSSNDSNNNINQYCSVQLMINFTTDLVDGSFTAKNQSFTPRNQLDTETTFSLNGTLKTVRIVYECSMSDYCDIDFVRETLSTALVALKVEPIRQSLADRLYNSSNTGPVICSNNTLCPQNTSFCLSSYSRDNGTAGVKEKVDSECTNLIDSEPLFVWAQSYTPLSRYVQSDIGVFYCNIPNCGSNDTVIETFQWLTSKYILPINMSILDITTTTSQSTTTTTTTTSTNESTTTTNYASSLFEHLNFVFYCFVIVVLLLY